MGFCTAVIALFQCRRTSDLHGRLAAAHILHAQRLGWAGLARAVTGCWWLAGRRWRLGKTGLPEARLDRRGRMGSTYRMLNL